MPDSEFLNTRKGEMMSLISERRNGRHSKATIAGVLAALALMVPGPAPAAASSNATDPRSAASGSTDRGEVEVLLFEEKNGNASSRCRKGEAYFTAKYSGDFKVYVRLGYGSYDRHNDYDGLRNYSYYFSGALTNARNTYGSYISTSSAQDLGIATNNYHTYGIAVHDKDTNERLWDDLYNVSVVCGYDYTIEINDA